MNNGHPQKIIPIKELRKYIEEGWEYIRDLGDRRGNTQVAWELTELYLRSAQFKNHFQNMVIKPK